MSDRQVLKKALSWLAVLFGLALSVLGFGLLGVEPLLASYHPPPPKTWLDSLTLFVFGVVPLGASVTAFRNRKFASLLCFVTAPLVSLVVWLSHIGLADAIFFHGYPIDQYPPVASAAITFVPLILLGYFWVVSRRNKWPRISAGMWLPVWTRIMLAAVLSPAFFACVCAMSVRVASMWEYPGDCGGPPPFSKPYPNRAVFVARVVNVDQITGAMGIVQQRFAGLPWWNKVVFLKFVYKRGTYFIDARFEEGIVTRWLAPVLDLKCTGSSRIEDAGVELRLFRDSPRWEGVRIIGRVLEPPEKEGWIPASGATVIVEGPKGSIVTSTDRDGIYDVSGLPPGHYSIRLSTPGRHASCQDFREGSLQSGDVWGCQLFTNSPE